MGFGKRMDLWLEEPPDLSDWRQDVWKGTRPAVIFNATSSETGERFVVASTDTNDEAGTIQFAKHFSGWIFQSQLLFASPPPFHTFHPWLDHGMATMRKIVSMLRMVDIMTTQES